MEAEILNAPLTWFLNLHKGKTMDEKSLIKQWNQMRSQIIQAQIAPALVLIAMTTLASLNLFQHATSAAKYLAIGVTAATGLLASISQYAAVREGEALLFSINQLEQPSALAGKIAASRGALVQTSVAIVGIDVVIFALVVWAVLGK
jgi:hypothetical protein